MLFGGVIGEIQKKRRAEMNEIMSEHKRSLPDREDLHFVALLGCQAYSLRKVLTAILWLHKKPFIGKGTFPNVKVQICTNLLLF